MTWLTRDWRYVVCLLNDETVQPPRRRLTGNCATTSTASESMADLMIDQLAQGDLRSGNLEVRLAKSSAEVDAAQALRYRVFYNGDGGPAELRKWLPAP